ncbi:MAG: methylmalonyl Co-A mutase-associated GTPase MeaB [Polyangiaceae bacterium]
MSTKDLQLPAHPLARGVVEGKLRSLARVCRLVDDAVGPYRDLLKQMFPHTGRAWTVGITGVPGAGKSTLTNHLIASLRAKDMKVAVLAIDPTSPFSGGAILGDRIRMQRHHGDEGVFIRSLATRGALGGLSRSAADLIRVCDAWGADVVLVETVGVGQDELEVTRTVDTTLVVMAPGMGDDIQAIKAGLLECADVFAVNKADRDGADITARQIEVMISIGQTVAGSSKTAGHGATHGHHGPHAACGAKKDRHVAPTTGVGLEGDWTPPIDMCVATKGKGVEEILDHLEAHHRWLVDTEAGQARRLSRLREAMRTQLRNTLIEHAVSVMGEQLEAAVQSVAQRQVDPYTASEQLVEGFRRGC